MGIGAWFNCRFRLLPRLSLSHTVSGRHFPRPRPSRRRLPAGPSPSRRRPSAASGAPSNPGPARPFKLPTARVSAAAVPSESSMPGVHPAPPGPAAAAGQGLAPCIMIPGLGRVTATQQSKSSVIPMRCESHRSFGNVKAFNFKKLKLSLTPSPQWPQAALRLGGDGRQVP